MDLTVIGLGKMGSALVKGIIEAGVFKKDNIIGCDIKVETMDSNPNYFDIKTLQENKKGVNKADLVLLAVKPQIINNVLMEIRDVMKEKVLISVAAGVTISQLKRNLPVSTRVVRVMPNTPSLIGEGVSALSWGDEIMDDDKKLVKDMLASTGEVIEVKENLMDAVTGLSGSGPAFVYIMIEALADAGVLNGLSRENSLKLAAQTVKGAAELVQSGEEHPGELKDMVTSPAGTTIQGVRELEKRGLRSALIEAVKAATDRSRELGE